VFLISCTEVFNNTIFDKETTTMTTAAAVEPGVELDRAIEVLEKRIEDKTAEVLEWESKEKEGNSLLSELRAKYIEAASEAVQGRKSPTDALSQQIEGLTEKLVGITRVVAIRRDDLSELRAALQPLQVEKTKVMRGKLVEEERVAVAELIGETERALTDLNAAAEKLANGINELRARKYLDEGNRRSAADNAQSLQRRAAGMRP
jgi:hypothetical protein